MGVGAGLRTYSVGGRAVIDGYDADELCPSGRGQLLVPWPNRIEDGRYEFGGRSHQLPLDEPERRNAIHGLITLVGVVGRRPRGRPGRVRARPLPAARLSVLAGAAHRVLALRRGSRVRTRRPTSAPTRPVRSGAHPYLAVDHDVVDEVELRVPAATCSLRTSAASPSAAVPWRTKGSTSASRGPIGATKLDHCFTDLEREDDGRACVELAIRRARFTLWVDESYPYLMIFTGDPLGRRPAQPRRRADDLRAERFSQRRGACPTRAGRTSRGKLGHLSQRLGRSRPKRDSKGWLARRLVGSQLAAGRNATGAWACRTLCPVHPQTRVRVLPPPLPIEVRLRLRGALARPGSAPDGRFARRAVPGDLSVGRGGTNATEFRRLMHLREYCSHSGRRRMFHVPRENREAAL